jgi:putative transcriptional regulator
MASIKDTIDDLAKGLHKTGLIDKRTLNDLIEDEQPSVTEYTGEEIQQIRKRQKLSQAVFAMYLNISPATIRSLEQGKRHAHGAILKLLNIVDRHGIQALI